MFQKLLFIYLIISTLLFTNVQAQSTLEIKLKCSQAFRMQIFYTGPEITKSWSEKFSVFKWITQSDEFVKYRISIKTMEKLDNIRIDFGETTDNLISINSIILENLDSIYTWNSELLFDEFYMNMEVSAVSISNNEFVFKTIDKPEIRNIDPFIHLYSNNNRLVKNPSYYHKITINLQGTKPNKIYGMFWFEGQDHLTVTKNYSPFIDKVTYIVFKKGKLRKTVFSLGDVLNSEYDIASLDYKSNYFNRKLEGSDILDYFHFNLFTEVSGKEMLHVKTRIYNGVYGPGFSSTQELISLKREITMLVTRIVLIIVSCVLLFGINSGRLTDRLKFIVVRRWLSSRFNVESL